MIGLLAQEHACHPRRGSHAVEKGLESLSQGQLLEEGSQAGGLSLVFLPVPFPEFHV